MESKEGTTLGAVAPLPFDAMLADIVSRIVHQGQRQLATLLTGKLARPLEQWSSSDILGFLDLVRAATNDDYMGLGSAPCPLGATDFIIDLGSRCATLRDAIQQAFRFTAMVTDALDFSLGESEDRATISIRRKDNGHRTSDVLIDWHMIVWHKFPQRLIGSAIMLDRAEFDHSLETKYLHYAGMFNTECSFNNDACRLVFASHYLDHRVVLRPDDARQIRVATSDYFSRPPGLAVTWKHKVSNVLRTEIMAGHRPPSLESLAEQYGTSPQTLRRRLQQEGASYRELKASARLEAALNVLSREGGTIERASRAAGFSDPAALNRAIKASKGHGAKTLREKARQWARRS